MNAHASPPAWPFGERVQRILNECEANPPPESKAPDVIAGDFRRFRNHALSAAPSASECEIRRLAIATAILADQFAKILGERQTRRRRRGRS